MKGRTEGRGGKGGTERRGEGTPPGLESFPRVSKGRRDGPLGTLEGVVEELV